MLFLSFRTLSSQRTLKVAKGFLLMVTSHAFHGQVDGPSEKEIAAQLNRASVELLKGFHQRVHDFDWQRKWQS